MQMRFHGQGEHTGGGRVLAEREARALDGRLVHVRDDLKHVDVTLTHHRRDDSYDARVVLRLPSRELVARSHAQWRDAALRDAFNDLRGQLDTHLARLRGEPARRRAARDRERLAETPPTDRQLEGA